MTTQPTLAEIGAALDVLAGQSVYDPYAYVVGYVGTICRQLAELHDECDCADAECWLSAPIRSALAMLDALDLHTGHLIGDTTGDAAGDAAGDGA